MPSKYVVRNFSENSYYHIYNRGVEKRLIFQDPLDYQIFIYYLFIYAVPLDKVLLEYPELPIRFYSKNLSLEVEVIAYCLMPNHFHLLVRQSTKNGVSKLLKQLTNAYTTYFNNKNQRVGGLFQGTFKAVEIDQLELLLHISRYIHLNPIVANLTSDYRHYKWSSLADYLDNKNWCSTEVIFSAFKTTEDYLTFISDNLDYARSLANTKHLQID